VPLFHYGNSVISLLAENLTFPQVFIKILSLQVSIFDFITCDPIWHVISRSGVVFSCLLYFTYFTLMLLIFNK